MRRLRPFLLILIVFMSACQMQKVTVSVYKPAKLIFPPEVRSLLVTSRYVPATGPYEDVQWGAYESVDSLKWSLSESVVDTLAKRMAAGNTFLVKARHLPRMLRNNDATLPDPLPWEGISALTKKEYVQSALIIEGFDIAKTPVTVNEADGKFSARFSTTVTLAIRLYEPDKRRLIDDSVYTFKSEFEGIGKTASEAGANLPDEKKALFAACSQAAEGYFSFIKPGSEIQTRYFYNKGDTSFIKADQAIKEGKWGRAESKWKWLAYNDPDTVIQAKASFNMALSCERDGRLNQAIGFARRSQRLNPSKPTLEYIGILEKKMLDIENQVNEGKIIKKW